MNPETVVAPVLGAVLFMVASHSVLATLMVVCAVLFAVARRHVWID